MAASVPKIVATLDSLGNNGSSYSATTVFTPIAAGLFRVSMGLVTADGNVGGGSLQVQWNDGNYNHSLNGSASYQAEFVLYSASSQAIKVAIPAFTAGTVTFDLHVKVEEL